MATMEQLLGSLSPQNMRPGGNPQGATLAQLLAGMMFDPETGRPRAVQAFTYGAEWVPLPASAAAIPRGINISASHDFLVFALVGTVRTAAEALVADEELTIRIEADASNNNLTDRAQDWRNLVGSAREPMYLPVPLFLRAGTAVTITITNLIATAKQVRLGLVGAKVFSGPMAG